VKCNVVVASKWLGVGALLTLTSACEDALKTAQDLREARVLGVKLSTAGNEASLLPGETASVELLLAGPDGPAPARVAYELCEAAESMRGVPYCVATPFARDVVDAGSPSAYDVPDELADAARKSLRGVACTSGEPALEAEDPLRWSCSGEDAPLRFSFDARLGTASFTNHHPDLVALEVTLDGVGLALEDVAAAAGCDAAVAGFDADRRLTLELRLGDDARELDETLQLSHFSTGGSFERQYSFVAPESTPFASLSFHTPASGSAVKQYLVIRDGRGGVSWASWSVCVR
jgi:hypothetical protein